MGGVALSSAQCYLLAQKQRTIHKATLRRNRCRPPWPLCRCSIPCCPNCIPHPTPVLPLSGLVCQVHPFCMLSFAVSEWLTLLLSVPVEPLLLYKTGHYFDLAYPKFFLQNKHKTLRLLGTNSDQYQTTISPDEQPVKGCNGNAAVFFHQHFMTHSLMIKRRKKCRHQRPQKQYFLMRMMSEGLHDILANL